MKHLLLLIAFIVVGLLPAQATGSTFSGGNGTSGTPYLISSKADLTTLAADVTGGTSYAGVYFQQTANIDYADAALTPIGQISGSRSFSGVYDGAGYSISHFTIITANGYVGLFAFVTGADAIIKNLGVTDATITSSGAGVFDTGALVGSVSDATITKCYIARCTVTGYYNVGSLAGRAIGTNISQCFVSGGTVSGQWYVGGLIGSNQGISAYTTNCYSNTAVTSNDNHRGGLVGQANANIENCYSCGTINATVPNGGLVGENVGASITNSYWDNTISPSASTNGTPKTTAEMKAASTYTGWDVTGVIWKKDASINGGYPFLSWQDGGGAALPVELTSFSASANGSIVTLRWNTAAEVNNYGFDVERKSMNSWTKIGFVAGHGTTNAAQNYSFSENIDMSRIEYRLKQIDRDGKFEYSKEVEVTAAGTPTVFALSQNYPNPFNPTTNISFTVPSTGRATLKIVNILGQEVATLFTGDAQSGITNHVQFNASGFASGMYFSRLEYNGAVQMTKMTLLK